MASNRERNDFIKFISDAAGNPDLAKKFLRRTTPLGIYRFFQQEGYKDIPKNDCADILVARNRVEGLRIPGRGHPWCLSGPEMGY